MTESREALFDELVKIGSDAVVEKAPEQKGSVGRALQAMLVGAAGGAVGYGMAELAARNLKFFQQPTPGRLRAAKIILPIMSGTAVMIADRYRKKMNDEYSKVPGWRDPSNK